MSYTKKLVCLASSRKMSGHCIAGKELSSGDWIRPVSKQTTGELLGKRLKLQGNLFPQLLDIVIVPLLKPKPHNYQRENHLVDSSKYWFTKGTIAWSQLSNFVDTVQGEIWVNSNSTYRGINDRVPENMANEMTSSLLLIRPEALVISVNDAVIGKLDIRAWFLFNNIPYRFAVTDPKIEAMFHYNQNGKYEFVMPNQSLVIKNKDGTSEIDASKVYLCLSLGEPYHEYCYKLVASIIIDEN